MGKKRSLVASLRSDIPASIVVFLVALPLCLGVALASGAPLISGIISGIIGGIIVGVLSKSSTSVSGPAAGLAAVVLASITELGQFDIFLVAVFVAGVLQLLMGVFKVGFIAEFIPSNVIKGLLAAIGIILILKQIPHAIGYDKDPEDDFSFFQADGENTFSELFKALDFITPGALIISLLSIFVLLFWDKTPLKKVKFLPASLFVVVMGVILNMIFTKYFPTLAVQPSHLVNIPKVDLSNLNAYLHLPNLGYLADIKVLKVAFTLAIIASLETLLNIEAVDKIDPHKRESPPNAELIAQGIGNIAAGLFGGIPVTSVIVRSSVNIQSNNATKLSAILHGFFMLVSVLVFSSLINQIPLASLAAILIMTGYKLASLKLFKEMYKKGLNQFLPFVITILAIVFTDLLIGVVLGAMVSIFFILKYNFKNPFNLENNKENGKEIVRLNLPDQVTFFNKASIKNLLSNLPENSKIEIEAKYTKYMDLDVLELIHEFDKTQASQKNIDCKLLNFKHLDKFKN